MSKRLYPYRDYSEHDVVNGFAHDTPNNATTSSGVGDDGVIVKVTDGDLNKDLIGLSSTSYLGKTDYPNIGRNKYPEVSRKVGAAGSGDLPLGVTLRETALYDENGEKITYYRQKALENQIIASGQAVPVLTRGILIFDDSAFEAGSAPAVDSKLGVAAGGKWDVKDATGVDPIVYGKVLATGSRNAKKSADQFAGAANGTGTYAMVQFDFTPRS